MTNLAIKTGIPPLDEASKLVVEQAQNALQALPQADIATHHVIHGGMYTRTVRIPAGITIVGATIGKATVLVVSGQCAIYVGDDRAVIVDGYEVIPGSAGRKALIHAYQDTYLTMVLPTHARTVPDAEADFTHEYEQLAASENDIEIITGE